MSETIEFDLDPVSVSDNDSSDLEAVLAVLNDTFDFDETALSYLDRIVEGIPNYYGYICYVSNNSYYLFFGSEYSVNDETVYFGNDCSLVLLTSEDNSVKVSRSSASGYSYTLSGLDYSNLVAGYPSLGSREIDYSFFLFVGLVSAFAVIIFNRSSRR